jgi:hypothetical protein
MERHTSATLTVVHCPNPGCPSSKGAPILLRAGLLAAAAVAFAGCRGVLGVDGYGTLPADAAPSTCQTCMDARCYDEMTRCAGEPACAALSACLAACDADDGLRTEKAKDACRVTCNLSTRRTIQMSRVIECAARSCDQCSAAHATFGGVDCTSCLKREARDTLRALSASIPALELEACQQDCSPGFEDLCLCTDLDFAGGADAGVEGGEVLARLRGVDRCSEDCARPDWSCLGLVKPLLLPKSEPPQLALHVRLAAFEKTLNMVAPPSLVGAEVSACTLVPECTAPSPLSDVTKEGTGLADLLLEPPRNSGAYFGDLAVQWSDDQGRMSWALLYFFPPLRRSPSWTWRRMVSRTIAETQVHDFLDENIFLDWENNGGIVWSVAACNGVPAEGVTARLTDQIDVREQVVYLTDTPVLSKTLKATSRSGLGAVLNVFPGGRTMELRSPEGDVIGMYPFHVSAGAITTLSFAPFTTK